VEAAVDALSGLVLDALPVLVSYVDAEGRYRLVNRAYEEWFGRSRAEVVGRTVREVLGDAAFEVLRPHVEAALSGRRVVFRSLVPYRDGGSRHVEARYEPHRGPGGRVLGFHALITDVSEHERAEVALRESEARFRSVADNAPVLIWVSGPDKGGTWFNRPWLDFTGRPMQDELGEGWLAGVHPDDLPSLAACAEAFEARRSFTTEFRLRRHDGAWRWMLDTGVPRFGADGTFLGFIGSCVDISERKVAEDRLRLHALLLESMAEGVSLATEDGVIVYANPAEERMFGYGPGELVGEHVSVQNAYLPEENARIVAEVIAALKAEGVWRGDWRNRRKDGSEFATSAHISAVEVEGRRHWLCVQADVTERKETEERSRLLLAELSHRVKNTLAVVQSVATRSLAGDRTLDEARDAFAKRIRALANAHTLLTASEWRGASLRALAAAELGPYRGRAEARGEDLALGPKAAQSLALILHELATNAAKHGALSAPEGRVELAWAVEGPTLRLVWREKGGPEVRSPARRGFGHLLVEEAAAHDLGSRARLEFRREGLTYELEAPLAQLVAG
jgi:PAS domain S-box-containing protein